MADKISVKAETIAHVVKEIENINQKYEEMSKTFDKIASLDYYSSTKSANAMNAYKDCAAVIKSLEGPLSTLGGAVMNSAQKFFEEDEHWSSEFAKLYYNIEG